MDHSSKPRARWRPARLRRSAAALLLLSLVATSFALTGTQPASAAPGDPFDCSVGTVWISQGPTETNGVPTQLLVASPTGTGDVAFTPDGAASTTPYNAVGFRASDGYLYGLRSDVGNKTVLVRIGEAGVVTDVGSVAGLPGIAGNDQYNQGTFGEGASADTLYVRNSLGGDPVYAIDVATLTATQISLNTAVPNLSDLVWLDGALWGFIGQTAYRLDITSGAVASFATGIPGLAGNDFGGQWVYGNGNVGLSANAGQFFQVAIGDPSGASPTFTLVSQSDAPASTRNDGASCPGLEVDLGITKVGPATYEAGEPISYTLTVTNEGPGASSGGFVNDSLPTNLTSPSTETPGCSFAGQDLTCSFGALAVGETFSIVVTATPSASSTGPIVNTASVLGNERDPNPANDEATATVIPDPGTPVLATAKSVDPMGTVTPGDVLTYSIDIDNTSDVDSSGTVFTDPAPFGTTYVAGSATLNGASIADVDGGSPFAAPRSVNSPGSADGVIVAGGTATVTFQVQVDSPLPEGLTEIVNQGTVGAEGIEDVLTNEVVNPVVDPALTLVKTADLDEFGEEGDVITYTFVATNTGDAALEGVEITDPLPGLSPLDCDADVPASLDPGDALTCTATYAVTAADLEAGQVDNTAEACGVVVGGPEVCAQDEVTVPAADPVVPTPPGPPAPGDPQDPRDPDPVSAGDLVRTGWGVAALLAIGLTLVALGGSVLAGRPVFGRKVGIGNPPR